jgi:hypothetical protein
VAGRVEHRGRDRFAIRDGIGGAPLDDGHHRRGSGAVARGGDGRQAQSIGAGGGPHRLLVLDLHQHRLAGADIGDRIGEQVGPLLLGERGGLALGRCRLVDAPRRRALADIGDDDPVADHELHRIDRRILRQREQVGALDPLARRVAESLGDRRPRGRTAHGDRGVRLEAGRLDGRAALEAQQQRAAAVLRPRILRASGRDAGDEGEQESDQRPEQEVARQARSRGRER